MSMSESPSPVLWSTVSALPDYLLLAQTRQLARHEQALQILVLDHLREIEARGLHLTRGYGSLFDYVVHELGYTAAAAWRRIKAMRLCSATNGARELLQDGKLNLSNAAQLQNLFERSDRGHGRGRPPGGQRGGFGPGGVPRNDGAAGEPASEAPMRAGGGDPAPGAGPVLDAAAREELVKRAAGKSTREVQQMVAEVDPELARPNDRMRALGDGRWELKATIDAECRHGLEKLQMLLSHTDPHLTLGGLVARLVRDGLDRYDPARPPRVRRSGSRSSASGERSASTSARPDTEAVPRNVARAKGGAVELRSEIEPDDVSGATVRGGAPHPSAAKCPSETEPGSASPAAIPNSGRPTTSPTKRQSGAEHRRASHAVARDGGRRAASAAKRHTEAGTGGAAHAAVSSSGGHTTSPTKRQSEAELGRAARAVARDGGGQADSPPKRHAGAEHGNANSAHVRGSIRRSDSAPKRVGQDDGVHTEKAERPCGAGASVPGRRRETEHACGQPKAMGGSGGRAASLAKRQGRADGDGRAAREDGVVERATCAGGLPFEAGGRNAARTPVRGGGRFPTSAAKRLAYAARHGAVGSVEHSPALERHLAVLSCFGAAPGSRSRYIPAAVRREVWRRDQGCCSYVDPHSGRRCGSRYRLEIDHIVPFALGGGAEPGNLSLRCRAHHRYRHAQGHAHPASVPTEALRTPGSAVDPMERGRTVGSHAAVDGAEA